MSEAIGGSGSCLCGATRFIAKNFKKSVGACHCNMCRKWGGGPFMAVDCGTEVSFNGEDNISVYNSSEWADRGFCNKCGSHLFYRLKESKRYMMPAGLFDNDKMFVFDHQFFVDERPAFYCFKNETKNMTGPEEIAKYPLASE